MTQTQTQRAAAGTDQRPWATYVRISKRKGDGQGASLNMGSQHAQIVTHLAAVAPGAELADFHDNASAWDETVTRDGWLLMLEGLAAGNFAGVVAWHADRFTRQPIELEHLIAACRKGGAALHTVMGGAHANPTMIRIESTLAANESTQKSERQKLKRIQMAERGVSNGGQRAYGYTRTRDALVPQEAAHIRWAAQQILAGKSVSATVRGLAERGATTATGKPWRQGNLGTYLRRPMLAGLRVHQGQIVGEAQWPALLDLGTWEAVRTLLENPERRVSKRAARVYLLSGLARCGSCGGAMRGRSGASNGRSAAYHCENAQGGCAYRQADLTDAKVRAMIVARLPLLDAAGYLAPVDDSSERELLAAQISELEANLAGLAVMALRGAITQKMLEAASAEAQATIRELEAQQGQLAVAARRPSAVLKGLAGMAQAAELYDAMTLDERRAVVSELCTIEIQPQGAGGHTFDPSLVEVTWRT